MAIEDITTTKEESSSDFGARLLTNVRETNRAKEKAFRKRQERDERDEKLFGIAGKIGIGLGDSYFKDQTDAFLNTEQMTQNVLTTRNAFKTATTTQEAEAAARAYKGGYKAYWLEQGKLRATPQLQANYGSIYNATQFANSLLAAGTDIGNKLQETHEQRLKLTNSYLSSRGVHEGKDAYLAELKKTNPQTLSQGITKMLGKFVGLTPDEQISKHASNIYTRASELEKFQDAYKQTGDTTYADIIAKETPEDFLNPAATLGDEVLIFKLKSHIPGAADIERPYRLSTVQDRKTGNKVSRMAFIDSSGNLTGESMSLGEAKEIKDFYEVFEGVLSEKKVLDRFKGFFEGKVTPETREKINDDMKKLVREKNPSRVSSSDITTELEGYEDRLYARLGSAAIIIQAQTGMEASAAAETALQMFEENPSVVGQGAFEYGAGIAAPYKTLQALINNRANVRVSKTHLSNFLGGNGRNIIRSFVNADKNQRVQMTTVLEQITGTEENPKENPLVPRRFLLEYNEVAQRIAKTGLQGRTLDDAIDEERQNMSKALSSVVPDPDAPDAPDVPEEDLMAVPKEMVNNVIEFAKENPWTTAGLVGAGVLSFGPAAAAGTAVGVVRVGSFVAHKVYPSVLRFIQRSLASSKTKAKFTERAREAAQASKTQTVPKTQRIGEAPLISKAKVAGVVTLGVAPVLDSLLSRPEAIEEDKAEPALEVGTAAHKKYMDSLAQGSVEDKIEFVGNILGDNKNNITFMKRVVNQESRMGKSSGTYKISADGKGSFGVAQVDKVAFDQVQEKLADSKSTIFDYVERFKDATGKDLTKIKYEDLKDDTLSIAFGRLYLMQLTADPIPETLEEQAAYWKKNYNTVAGAGTAHNFINRNRMKDFK